MGKLFTRTGLAFIGAVLLGITACSTNASTPPASSPPPSVSPTPPTPVPSTGSPPGTPAPAETPIVETARPEISIPEPEKYPQMANDDLEGADAAARYFLDLYGYVYNTGDLKAWEKISSSSCAVCEVVTEHANKYYARGNWFENFHLLHGESVIYYPSEDQPAYLVTLEVLATPYEHYDASGKLISTSPELTYPNYGIYVQYSAPYEWIVTGVGPGEYQ